MALKIKFVQIDSDIYMRVLEQGDEIERGCGAFFTASNGIELCSAVCPQSLGRDLYVRGLCLSDDNIGDVSSYCTPEEARATIERYVQAVREYNRSLAATENSNNDVVVVITE